MSNFETGGLVTEVRSVADNSVVAKPIRYLHRDYLQQDLSMGEYMFIVRDPADHLANNELKDLINCNKFRMHLSLEGSSSDSCLKYDDISGMISTSETERNFIFYEHVKLVEGMTSLDFVVEEPLTIFKVLAEARLDDVEIGFKLFSGGDETVYKQTGTLEQTLSPGTYTLQILVSDTKRVDEVNEKICENQLKLTSYSLSIGISESMPVWKYTDQVCKKTKYEELPTKIAVNRDAIAPELQYTITPDNGDLEHGSYRDVELDVSPYVEGL